MSSTSLSLRTSPRIKKVEKPRPLKSSTSSGSRNSFVEGTTVYPGAKERLVQITGPNQDSISSAKTLIEETILRNASPVRNETLSGSTTSLNSSASDESHNIIQQQRPPYQHSMSMPEDITREYKHTVKVGNNYIKLCGDNLEMVQSAKLVLDEYFCGASDDNVNNDIIRKPFLNKTNIQDQIRTEEGKGDADTKTQGTTGIPKRVMYPREFLIKCSISPLCSKTPKDWARIVQEVPDISRKVEVM